MSTDLKTRIIKCKDAFNLIRERRIIERKKGKVIYEEIDIYADRVASDFLDLLLRHGTFYLYNNTISYFDDLKHCLHLVSPGKEANNSFQKLLSLYFNFTLNDNNAARIYSRLYPLIEEVAIPAHLHLFSHYDFVNNTLYIRKSNTHIYKITDDSLKILPNGTDQVMFRTNNWMEDITVEPNEVAYDRQYLNRKFFNRIWFNAPPAKAYTRERQAIMFKKWFYSTFFDTLITKKPILVLQGATGTGKTSTLVNVGTIMYGRKFGATSLPEDKKDLINSMVNNHFLVLDNVDENPPPWFLDTVTAITTGGILTYRPLYENVTVPSIHVQPECFLAISSRTPEYNRADVANRAIVNTLIKPERSTYNPFRYENEIIRDRQEIWTHILGELQHILHNLGTSILQEEHELRMAEFADFVIRSSDEGEERDYIEETLSIVIEMQHDFAAQNKPIVDALKDYVSTLQCNVGYTPEDLLAILNEQYQMGFKSTRSMGMVISRCEETLKNYIVYEKRVVQGAPVYNIGPKVIIPTKPIAMNFDYD